MGQRRHEKTSITPFHDVIENEQNVYQREDYQDDSGQNRDEIIIVAEEDRDRRN